ncbi:AfsR/SARP family transcriptional regulator, partial [Microbispora corallina]|uniref:AfsR/SARP family transcriptional regulator n=1 Tax=Microbispora corallina TaxID=83302 RepID=UPI0031DF2A2E
MRIALLGPVEARDDAGLPIEVAGLRLRTLLARLALTPGRPVAPAALTDAIWGDDPPAGAANALQSLVSRLRRALPSADAALLESLPYGYRLRVGEGDVDAGRFERLAADGRSALAAALGPRGDPHDLRHGELRKAAERLAEALALWRGAPLADLGDAAFASAEVARWTETRLRAVEDLAEARLALGDPAALVAELDGLAAAHPLRERLWALRMRALDAAGRTAVALAVYDDLRRTLADALGADPSPEVRALHVSILRGAPRHRSPSDARQAAEPSTAPPAALPVPLTSFVGREEDLARLAALVPGTRLVTLTGPGGAGKTRLACEVAARVEMPGGIWPVDLAAVHDPARVPSAVAAALGVRDTSQRDTSQRDGARGTVERLAEALRERRALIVLDTCEHLVEACARLAEELLGRCPGLRVLATSREPLAVTGEVLHPVGPLAVPPEGVSVAEASRFPAVRLFLDRAAAVRPGFALTEATLPAVAEVCRRLDGLPLALELACARLRTLPLEEIARRLEDRFRLLTAGSRTALPRHRTLLAVVEWSWGLLTEPERTLARRLAVFAGGATAESAEAVCADPPDPRAPSGLDGRPDVQAASGVLGDVLGASGLLDASGVLGGVLAGPDVLPALAGLVDKSFVVLVEPPGGPPRYRMLDTIRAYAAATPAAPGEAERVRRAHAAHFLALAEAADPALRTSAQLEWLARLGRERAELTAALRRSVDEADAGTAIRLTAALGWFWNLMSAHEEAASWLRDALALPGAGAPGTVSGRALARAYAFHTMHHFAVQDPEAALRSAAETGRLTAAEPGLADDPVIALMSVLADMHPDNGHGGADAHRRLDDLTSSPDPWLAAAARLFRGLALTAFGGAGRAAADLTAARDAFAVLGDRWGTAVAVSSLGGSHSLGGDHATAVAALTEGLRFLRVLGSGDDAAWMLVELGLERTRMGDLDVARSDLEEAETYGRARRSPVLALSARTGLGDLARVRGDLPAARALLSAALRDLQGVAGVPGQLRARALTADGRVRLADGDVHGARDRVAAALAVARTAGERPVVAAAVEGLAAVAGAEGRPREAARLLGL